MYKFVSEEYKAKIKMISIHARERLDVIDISDEKIVIKSPLFNFDKLRPCFHRDGDFESGREENFNN